MGCNLEVTSNTTLKTCLMKCMKHKYCKSVDFQLGIRRCYMNDLRRACETEWWSDGNLHEVTCDKQGKSLPIPAFN